MPVISNLVSFELFAQLKNGSNFSLNTSDFTTELVGNVGEKVRATFQVSITWIAESGFSDEWQLINSGATGTIIRTNGTFLNDGFIVGDVFEWYDDFSTRFTSSAQFTGTITGISTDGKTLIFSSAGPISASATGLSIVGIWSAMNTTALAPDAAILRFGLIGNSEQFNTLSKVTEEAQAYYIGGMNLAAGLLEPMSPQGTQRGWQTGSAEIRLASVATKNTSTYEVQHDFIITPYFIASYLNDLINGTTPSLFANNNSLKYAFELEFRNGLSAVNSKKLTRFQDQLGQTGWFNENFAGFNPDYQLVSISYEDSGANAADGVIVDDTTTITIEIEKVSGSFAAGQKAAVYISYLPQNEDDYKGQTDEFQTIFMYDTIIGEEGAGPTAGSGILDNCTVTLSSGNIIIEVDAAYTAAQQTILTNQNNPYFAIWVQVEDSALSAPNSDRVAVLADAAPYQQESFITGLTSFDSFELLTHPETLTSGGNAGSILQWNEDGILADVALSIDTAQNTVINAISAKLVAYKASDQTFFELDSTDIDLSTGIVSSNIQQFNIDTTRGYVLAVGDEFNFVKLTTGSLVGSIQSYSLQFGQKIRWQEWIENLNVDTVFYDSNEPNNNLNQKSSNYSGLNGYEIKLIIQVDTQGEDANGVTRLGRDFGLSGDIEVNDYGVSVDGWGGTLELLDPDTLASTGGQILSNKNTLMRVTWTHSTVSLVGTYAIHRLEFQNANGDGIEELSTVRDAANNQILFGDTTPLRLDASIVSSNLVTESLIDFTKINPNSTYKLSARVGLEPIYSRWTGDTGGGTGDDASLINSSTGLFRLTGSLTTASGAAIGPDTGNIVTLEFDFGNSSVLSVEFDYSANIADISTASFTSSSITLTRNDGTSTALAWTDIRAYVGGSIVNGSVIVNITKPDFHTNTICELFGENAVAFNVGLDLQTTIANTSQSIAPFAIEERYDASLKISDIVTRKAAASTYRIDTSNLSSLPHAAVLTLDDGGTLKKAYSFASTNQNSITVTNAGDKDSELWASTFADGIHDYNIESIVSIAYAASISFDDFQTGFNTSGVTIDLSSGGVLNSFTTFGFGEISTLDASVLSSAMGANNAVWTVRDKLTSSEVDNVLIDLDGVTSGGFTGRIINVDGQSPAAPPTGASAAAIASLTGKGITVNTD